jgi:anti-sigma B factor antagonist
VLPAAEVLGCSRRLTSHPQGDTRVAADIRSNGAAGKAALFVYAKIPIFTEPNPYEGMMLIEERSAGDVTILDLKGKMTLGEGDEVLKDKINSMVLQGRKKLVLNLADVPYIDSAGLGEIVRTYTTVSRQGGSLKLLSLTKRITDLLSITKLLTVFETYDSEADAVRSFQTSANV